MLILFALLQPWAWLSPASIERVHTPARRTRKRATLKLLSSDIAGDVPAREKVAAAEAC